MMRRAARRGAGSGFTLIELMVSLVAGLIVAMAVMGVSKEATNTFHEEVRVSGAEMSLRIAMERIRLDLQRAAFMGTGNIIGDPMVAHLANYTGTTPNLSNFVGATIPYSFQYLSGIALHPQQAAVVSPVDSTMPTDAAAKAQLAQATPTGLQPDSIDIGGNFSSSDEYAASIVWNPPGAGGCVPAGPYANGTLPIAAAISIEMTTPAGWRLRNAELNAAVPNAGFALQAAFHPGASATSEFLLKLTDQSGRTQYLVGCAGGVGVATSYTATPGSIPTALVYLAPVSAVMSSTDTGGLGGVAGFSAGWVTVSPLQVARWDIQSPTQLAATTTSQYLYGQTATALGDASNYRLTRSFVDFSAGCSNSGPCAVDPATTEVIAEYAVDMKFGLTVDAFPACPAGATAGPDPKNPCPVVAPQYTSQPLFSYPIDSLTSANGGSYAAQSSITYTTNIGPQRIRDVQVRLGIRSPFGDRAVTIAPPAATNYLYRYKLDSTALHYNTAMSFARVRESTTEVNLPNQARFFW